MDKQEQKQAPFMIKMLQLLQQQLVENYYYMEKKLLKNHMKIELLIQKIMVKLKQMLNIFMAIV